MGGGGETLRKVGRDSRQNALAKKKSANRYSDISVAI